MKSFQYMLGLVSFFLLINISETLKGFNLLAPTISEVT